MSIFFNFPILIYKVSTTFTRQFNCLFGALKIIRPREKLTLAFTDNVTKFQENRFARSQVSAGAYLAFLPSCNMVAFLQEDDDVCIWMYEFTLYIFTVR